ncbi:hypothetical protein G4B88_012843 [Cannabis sativa]|uniref:O-fucosyltransferase family protein n=1 Tax=Cannabis sativa TaxID=3483 RepID=A0A7J6EHH9_CANSA|nr:hypothetical protein G4B88_012843 [Cannabis sativa]
MTENGIKYKYVECQKKIKSLEPILDLHTYSTLKVVPRLQKYGVIHFTKSDSRLANNGIPLELQKLRCRVNYRALKFTPKIEETGKKIVEFLRRNGPFVVLHLRYEMDIYAYPWWKQKEIDSVKKRKMGECPLTPEETALTLRALDIDPAMQIYIAAGNIYEV